MMNELPLMEQFVTVQGEGFYSGRSAVFIRLGGCDVGCVWCDVKESWEATAHPMVSIENIVKSVKKFKTNFVNGIRSVFYQVACHQRVQNIGQVTKKILELIPETDVEALERCSGHDGTYGVRKETHTYSVKIGMPVAKKITDDTDLVVSDCVMAGNHVAHIASQDIDSIHPISLVKMAYGL